MEVPMSPGFQRRHFMLRLSMSKRPAVQQPLTAALFNLVLWCSVLLSCTWTGVQAATVTLNGSADAPPTATATLNGAFSKLEIARAQRYLKTLSEATVRSIQSPDGDIIDCVLREKQPAFNHPLLKNHTIQEFPSSIPAGMLQEESAAAGPYSSSLYGTQLWHRNGRCAKGTVPIRRPSISSILDTHQQRSFRRLRSIARYNISRSTTHDIKHQLDGIQFQHEYAIAGYGIRAGGGPGALPVYGTYVVLNVWNPSVTVLSDMSIAQLWLTSGNYKGTNLDSVEVGWTVEPLAYGDTSTRLFIYWTNDAYTGDGCLDLRCPGFVQVSSDIALGGTFIGSLSTYKGSQREVQPILVWKDPGTGNWWLRIGITNVGYWPSSLFKSGLSQYADTVQWGGEIVNSWPDGHHTNTQMGSGHFSNEGFGGACYARSLSTVDSSNTLSSIPLSNVRTISTNRDCYDIQTTSNDNWGSAIFFGGPGFNPNCL